MLKRDRLTALGAPVAPSRNSPRPLILRHWLVGACAWLLLCAASAWGSTFRVGIGDDCDPGVFSCFTPSRLTIDAGDSVEFYQYADSMFTGFHNVVADDGSFRCARGCDGEGGDGTPVSDSICSAMGCVFNPQPNRLSFVRTFSAPGVVKYHDEVSKAAGVITVGEGQSFGMSIPEVFTNADGTAQFILLWPGAGSLAGRELISDSGVRQNRYTFPNDLEGAASGRPGPVLIATQTFADLQLIKPDFIVPNGFLFAPAGSIGIRNLSYTYKYTSMPNDGRRALYPVVDYDIGAISYDVGPAVAVNHAREYVALAPIPRLDVIEYYNAQFDEFFLTAYPEEITALDTGRFAGWQRTGYSLPTWSGPPVNASIIPDVDPVCRVLLGASHFFSLNGCADTMALPGALLETGSAFYATLPNQDGNCPAGQQPVFQLRNPLGTTHRYTVRTDVRDEMLSRGFISDGYGRYGVAMCVPDSSAP